MELDGSRLSEDKSSKCYMLETCHHQRETSSLTSSEGRRGAEKGIILSLLYKTQREWLSFSITYCPAPP